MPPPPIRELRDLTRARASIARDRARESNGWRSSSRTPRSNCPVWSRPLRGWPAGSPFRLGVADHHLPGAARGGLMTAADPDRALDRPLHRAPRGDTTAVERSTRSGVVLLPWLGQVRLPVDPGNRLVGTGSAAARRNRRAKPVLTACRSKGPEPATPPGSQPTTDWAKPRIVQST